MHEDYYFSQYTLTEHISHFLNTLDTNPLMENRCSIVVVPIRCKNYTR